MKCIIACLIGIVVVTLVPSLWLPTLIALLGFAVLDLTGTI